MNKQKLYLEIEEIIGAGVINGEEVDVTTKKIVDKYWNILQYCDDKKFSFCPYCGEKLRHFVETDVNSKLICKNPLCWKNEQNH